MPENKLSSIDTAWYQLDTHTDPTDIVGVLIFDGRIDYARLESIIERRFLRFDRFRQRVVGGGLGRPSWEEAEDFDLHDHLEPVRLVEPAGTEELQNEIARTMNSPLDRDLPLWKLRLVENFREGAALIFQLHHCLGDGFALAHVLLGIADEQPGAASAEKAAADRPKGSEALEMVGRAVASLGHLVKMPFEPATLLKRPLLGKRRVSWSKCIDLARVKEIAHRSECTVNDVLIAALTGAWRRYLGEHDESVDQFDIRALVPVNLRPQQRIEEMPDELGNHFGLVFLDLPTSLREARDRLLCLHTRMNALKESPQPHLLLQLLRVLGRLPKSLEHSIVDFFGKKASTVVTNLPGPKESIYVAGRRLSDLMFWAPHPARLGSNASIVSYAGRVRVGLRGDENVLADPHTVARYFEEEFEVLAADVSRENF